MKNKKNFKTKNFIFTGINFSGSNYNIEKIILYIKKIFKNKKYKKKNVLILGSSSGYGFLTSLILTFGYKYNVINVFKEKMYNKFKNYHPGSINIKCLKNNVKKNINLYSKYLNLDIFLTRTIKKVISIIRKDLNKIDILVYSISTSKIFDEESGNFIKSSLKPVRFFKTIKNINFENEKITKIKIQKATDNEIKNTLKIMGGHFWKKWIFELIKKNVINENFKTIAYSYLGTKIKFCMYNNSTIGLAKRNLFLSTKDINKKLIKYNGNAFVSYNEAILTQSSLAIPGICLYLAILNEVKIKKKIKQNVIDQLKFLFDNLDKIKKNYINLNNNEFRFDVQKNIQKIIKQLNNKNIKKYISVKNFKKKYFKMYGIKYL